MQRQPTLCSLRTYTLFQKIFPRFPPLLRHFPEKIHLLDLDDVAKLENSFSIMAPRIQNHLRIVANAFRVLELCLALFLFFWISAQLPIAVRIFCEYSRQLLSFVARPVVVFFFFNAIVAAVAAKSGRLAAPNSSDADCADDFYEEIVKFNERRNKSSISPDHEDEKEIIIFQDKQIISSTLASSEIDSETESESSDGDQLAVKCPRVYRRTKSEKMARKDQTGESKGRHLRRSETEKWRKVGICGGDLPDPEEELSSEEFQRAIENFIAKQLTFRREESMAIVLK